MTCLIVVGEDQCLNYLIKAVSIHGSDDKATSAVPTQILLQGWTGVGLASVEPNYDPTIVDSNDGLTMTLRLVTCGQKHFCTIFWDMPATLPLQSLIFLPVLCIDQSYRGLVLQRVTATNEIPTFVRVGTYQSLNRDPVLELGNMEITGVDWDQKLLSAPLIRLI